MLAASGLTHGCPAAACIDHGDGASSRWQIPHALATGHRRHDQDIETVR
jgi:hypothetical protein